MNADDATAPRSSPATLRYDVTALEMPIYFNREGDHDHSGLIFALTKNVPILRYIRALAEAKEGENPGPPPLEVIQRADEIGVDVPRTKQDAQKPHPLVRPLVLRGRLGDRLEIELRNEIRKRYVGLHLVADGYDVKTDDGSHVGENQHSLAAPRGPSRTYTWQCDHEGVFPFHDGGNYSGGEDGTNAHGLFGALIVEPPGSIWRDPVTGRTSEDQPLDGLYLDVIPSGKAPSKDIGEPTTTLENHVWDPPKPYTKFDKEAHREFVIFFHDEPEFVPPHGELPESPCDVPCEQQRAGAANGAGGAANALPGGTHGGGGGHGDLPIMPISYRAEPMINRERTLWKLICDGHVLERPVLNEEQHHSSWMFGDPATPILKAYIGDPVRIRLVHAGVLETHVFHLHLYEWHAVPQDKNSPRIDAISVSPQTGHTIEPVWGAGNRHQVAGDVIWHCHLYPHFHEGMWGMFRMFETLQMGVEKGDFLASDDPVYAGRRIGRYPDETPIEKLLPLPDRPLPPRPTATHPGYPLYIPGTMQQKSPIPPWPDATSPLPPDYDYRPAPTTLERNAFNAQPVPGEMFTRNPFKDAQSRQWAGEPDDPADPKPDPRFDRNGDREIHHDVAVDRMEIEYNSHGWRDRDGHLYYRVEEGHPSERPGPKEPLFFRALHGQILNLTLQNDLPRVIERTEFDLRFPPCDALPWEGECATHVHMVKFDPICGDGASTGWNYISGPVIGKKMVYRWWLDQEFGTIFFHDHLFANYRQKHGLFGALIVEPIGAEFFDPYSDNKIVSGLQARIKLPGSVGERVPLQSGIPNTSWVREFCIGIADFIPMWDKRGLPLNPPDHPGGHGDQGVMALNYRNAPIRERLGDPKKDPKYDPANWFSSRAHGDPDTTLFATFENDPVWIRLVQGSHEEQHSFQIHGMRWRRFRANLDSSVRNQQTTGLSEAFTFINHEPFGPGDYLYKLSSADDLWLGCWGIFRAYSRNATSEETGGLLPLGEEGRAHVEAVPPADATVRRFHVVAEPRRLQYREPDLVDPFALVYRLTSVECSDGTKYSLARPARPEPLVIRCCEGDVVEMTVTNDLPEGLRPEPFAPEVPVEGPARPVSRRVSLHADLVRYDIRSDDGSNVGDNPDQTIPPGESRTYRWRATRPPQTSPGQPPNAGEPLGPVLLQDMADFRNHRHHGLVGALVVEDPGTTPYEVSGNEATAGSGARVVWHGARVTTVRQGTRYEEIVLLLQDGLRLYLHGNLGFPLPDAPPGHGEAETDHEDQGQKGFNYRTELVGPNDDPRCAPNCARDWLAIPNPATPVWRVPVGSNVRFHLVGACDKPRNHSFTIHGVTWPEWRFLSPTGQPRVASESAISSGTVRTFEFTPVHTGDHAYRSGVLKWAVSQGLWGILRVVGKEDASPRPRTGGIDLRAAAWAALALVLGCVAAKAWDKKRE